MCRHKHKIKSAVIRCAKRGVRAHDTELLTLLVEKSYFLESYRLIDEIFFCCYCSSPPNKLTLKNKTREAKLRAHIPWTGKNIDQARCAAG